MVIMKTKYIYWGIAGVAVLGLAALYWFTTDVARERATELTDEQTEEAAEIDNETSESESTATTAVAKKSNLYEIKNDFLLESATGKRLLTTKVGAMVDPEMGSSADPAQEWAEFEHSGKVFLYVLRARGCGGCVWTDHYFEIDPITDKAVLKQNADTAAFGLNADLSPGGTKAVVMVLPPYPEDGEPKGVDEFQGIDEQVWSYDLATKTKKKLVTLPRGATLQACGDGCSMDGGVITWSGDTVTINPYKAPRESVEVAPDHYELSTTRFGRTWTFTI